MNNMFGGPEGECLRYDLILDTNKISECYQEVGNRTLLLAKNKNT
jgi:hypothetical protein